MGVDVGVDICVELVQHTQDENMWPSTLEITHLTEQWVKGMPAVL